MTDDEIALRAANNWGVYETTEHGPFSDDGEPAGVSLDRTVIDWVIVGGESGPGARPMHPDWARDLRDQCVAAGVPFFFKQWGRWTPVCEMSDAAIDACYHAAPERHPDATRRCKVSTCVLHSDGHRFDGLENGAYAQGSGAMMMMDIGKKKAGALLDGREHKAFPDG